MLKNDLLNFLLPNLPKRSEIALLLNDFYNISSAISTEKTPCLDYIIEALILK